MVAGEMMKESKLKEVKNLTAHFKRNQKTREMVSHTSKVKQFCDILFMVSGKKSKISTNFSYERNC